MGRGVAMVDIVINIPVTSDSELEFQIGKGGYSLAYQGRVYRAASLKRMRRAAEGLLPPTPKALEFMDKYLGGTNG